jgi:hypothetical protein
MESQHISGMVTIACPAPTLAHPGDALTEDSGSDVPIHLYSFSFNLNPDWTQALADQEEILACQCAYDIPLPSNTHLNNRYRVYC